MGFLSSAFSSVVDAGVNIWATNKNNKLAKHAADTQRGWEEYMSNTAHQREMEDLKKAGLNPILTAMGGNGASTPSGATAQVTPYNPLNIMSSALEMEKNNKEIQGIQEGINKTEAETAQLNLDTAIKRKMAPSTVKLAKENVKIAIAEQAAKNAQTKLTGKQQAKIQEEIKQIKGGKLTNTIGTEPVETVKDFADKAGIEVKKSPHEGFKIKFKKKNSAKRAFGGSTGRF